MERQNMQPTFTDLALCDLGGPRANAFFEVCDREIPFDLLAESVANIFKPGGGKGSKGGAPHWPVAMMLKVVFIQKVFALSDPAAEEMIRDRISFRRFLRLSIEDKTPDHSTINDFHHRLMDSGHGSTLFEKALQILRERGLVLNTGTLIDATIMQAPLGGKRKDGTSCADPCASTTVKGGRGYFGYRAHVATDRNGIITDYVFDTASVSEHEHFDQLARNEQKAVFADSGCRSRDRVEKLRNRGVVAGLCHRRVRGQKELTADQRRLNRLIAPIRAFVEHPFAWIQQRLHNRRVRYRGLRRNAFDFSLSAMACNFCRSFSLRPA